MENIMSQLKGLGENYSALVVSPAENLQEIVDEIVASFTKEGVVGIYVALNKPYRYIVKILKQEGTNTEKVFFIDCITASVEKSLERKENVLYIPGPSDLTSLNIAIGQFCGSIPGNKFLIIDALRTLLIYNDENTIARFMESLTKKCTDYNMKLVVITTVGKDKELMGKITPYFGKLIETWKPAGEKSKK